VAGSDSKVSQQRARELTGHLVSSEKLIQFVERGMTGPAPLRLPRAAVLETCAETLASLATHFRHLLHQRRGRLRLFDFRGLAAGWRTALVSTRGSASAAKTTS